MYCVNCGEKNREDAKFCSRCGKAIEEVAINDVVTEVNQGSQAIPSVQEQINKGKLNKNILLIIGILLVIVGGFVLTKPLLSQKESASATLYTGIDSLMSAHAFDFNTKIVAEEVATIKGNLELGDSLAESKAAFNILSDGEKIEVELTDGIISDNSGDKMDIDEMFYYSGMNSIRWDNLVKDGSIDKEWIFDQIDTFTGIISTHEIPFRIPKAKTIDILLKDFFLNYAQDKKIEDELFVYHKKEESNHYVLTINTWDFVGVFSDYLDTVIDDSRKIEKLGLKNREVDLVIDPVKWFKESASESGLRDELIKKDVDFEVKLNKKNQLESLSVSTPKDIGIKFDIELTNYKEAKQKRK